MLHKHDIVQLMDGTKGRIEQVVKTERTTVYKIRVKGQEDDRYFEEDKIQLIRQHPINRVLNFFAMVFRAYL